MKRNLKFLALILSLTFLISGCSLDESASSPISSSVTLEVSSEAATFTPEPTESPTPEPTATPTPTPTPTPSPTPASTPIAVDISSIPAYSGNAYTEVNGNVPYFTESDYTTTSFESYSDLDNLGRCVLAYACIGEDIMPTEKRGEIGQVKPSGWQTVRYDGLVDGNYLYNRCHLIGYQLSGENANEQNLITGTRYLNIEGMLPFENMVADYVKETKNHVLYRVTPIFDGDNLLASGVLMEGYSVEDEGAGVSFCVYAYNVQPGVTINYANGESELAATPEPEPTEPPEEPAAPAGSHYIGNANTKKFHYPDCSSVKQMKESNKVELSGTRDEIISMGFEPCKRCNP